MFMIAIALLLAGGHGKFPLRGTIRASDSASPIAGALVEALDGDRRTWSDSAGAYALDLGSPGVHRIRISCIGYKTSIVDVIAAPNVTVRLDIVLALAPVRLATTAVVGRSTNRVIAAHRDIALEVGSRSYTGNALHANPLFAEPDAEQVLTTAPDVLGSPEFPTSLHVRGGAGDQNLVLLDGVPLYDPQHAAGMLSAINPDIVSRVTLHAGVPSARFGDATSGVIAIETDPSTPRRITVTGAFGPRTIRQTLSLPLPGFDGTLLVSGRQSLPDLVAMLGSQTNRIANLNDIFVRSIMHLGRSALEVFEVTSRSRVTFAARPDGNETEPDSNATPFAMPITLTDSTTPARMSHNRFVWSTGTQAIVWRSTAALPVQWELRAWHTGFNATSDWMASTGLVDLTSSLVRFGAGGNLSWPIGGTTASAGFDIEPSRIQDRVTTMSAADSGSALSHPLDVTTSMLLASVFLEDTWTIDDQWSIRAGIRTNQTGSISRDLDPRLSMAFTPVPSVTLSAGYARMHQQVQSLGNEESLVSGILGIEFPIAAHAAEVPIAESDQLTGAAEARLGHATTARLDVYTRRLAGNLLVAPVTAQPFALATFANGVGRASGVAIAVEHRGDRVDGEAAYGFAVTTRRAGDQRYTPAFTHTHTLTLGVAYHLHPTTSLRVAAWGAIGRRASLNASKLDWTPSSIATGTDDFSGSPQQFVGALDGVRLPAYLRIDLGIRQVWHPMLFGRSAAIVGSAALNNILNRHNGLGAAQGQNGTGQYLIPAAPRSLLLGIEWIY